MGDLPFRCRMLGDAACDDVVVKSCAPPKDGKHEVLYPVCLPNEGTFDWADQFLETHDDYVELSDRMLKDWATRSGLQSGKPGNSASRASHDRPGMNFQVPLIDDGTTKLALASVLARLPRNVLMMEVQGNLLSEKRAQSAKRFSPHTHKRVAQVMIGEPPLEFKKKVVNRTLKEKESRIRTELVAKKSRRHLKRLSDF